MCFHGVKLEAKRFREKGNVQKWSMRCISGAGCQTGRNADGALGTEAPEASAQLVAKWMPRVVQSPD